MTGKKDSISFKKITANPIILSFLIGIILFLLPIELPEILNTAVSAVSSMNAPVAMIILGIYLAQIKVKDPDASMRGIKLATMQASGY